MGDLGPDWCHLGSSWAVLGRNLGHLGRSWAILGPSWAILGRLGVHLGPSWGPSWAISCDLGPFWGDLGVHLGRSWGILGPSWVILGRLGADLGPSCAILELIVLGRFCSFCNSFLRSLSLQFPRFLFKFCILFPFLNFRQVFLLFLCFLITSGTEVRPVPSRSETQSGKR